MQPLMTALQAANVHFQQRLQQPQQPQQPGQPPPLGPEELGPPLKATAACLAALAVRCPLSQVRTSRLTSGAAPLVGLHLF